MCISPIGDEEESERFHSDARILATSAHWHTPVLAFKLEQLRLQPLRFARPEGRGAVPQAQGRRGIVRSAATGLPAHGYRADRELEMRSGEAGPAGEVDRGFKKAVRLRDATLVCSGLGNQFPTQKKGAMEAPFFLL